MLPSFQKDFLPAHKRNNIAYNYLCHCDSVYVGRTSQQLEERIRQHVPKFIRNEVKPQKDLPTRHCKFTHNAPISDSAIGQHLLDNKVCAEKFDINWFLITAVGRSFFYLAALEAIYIESFEPSLCCHKEFVYGLKLSRLRRKDARTVQGKEDIDINNIILALRYSICCEIQR